MASALLWAGGCFYWLSQVPGPPPLLYPVLALRPLFCFLVPTPATCARALFYQSEHAHTRSAADEQRLSSLAPVTQGCRRPAQLSHVPSQPGRSRGEQATAREGVPPWDHSLSHTHTHTHTAQTPQCLWHSDLARSSQEPPDLHCVPEQVTVLQVLDQRASGSHRGDPHPPPSTPQPTYPDGLAGLSSGAIPSPLASQPHPYPAPARDTPGALWSLRAGPRPGQDPRQGHEVGHCFSLASGSR